MNVRIMVMVMLVLAVMVQGVSADSITTFGDTLNDSYPENSYFSYSVNFTNGVAGGGTWQFIRGKSGASTSFTYSIASPTLAPGTIVEGTGQSDSSVHFNTVIAGCGGSGCNIFLGQLVYFSASLEAPSVASGSSCTGSGTVTYYGDGEYMGTDSDGGNYSFAIFNGTNYQIHYTDGNISEWHNFTATTSDDTWTPGCPTYPLSGTITALDGEGVYNLQVFLHEWYLYERDLVDSTFTDANGTYSFSDVYEGVYSLAASGYCNSGVDCAVFNIDAPITVGNWTNSTYDYTWHIPSNLRIELQYENDTAVSNALLHIKDLPADAGTWRTTATDGYTTYTSMQTSRVYVDYHGGDVSAAGSDVLHSFQLTPNAQYRNSQFTLTIPDDFANNTTIPPAPPVIDEANKTDITNMSTDATFVVTVRDSVSSAPLKDVTVTATAADKNFTGQFNGYTNASGQWSFPKNNTVGQYDVSVALTCYLPQTKSRYSSATFDLEYSCGPPPGTDENGTGNWNENASNWTFNGTLENENDTKNKFNSLMYVVISLGAFVLVATYFKKK